MLDMKKNSILSMIISFAMICSCQKQDSAAEQQLAQRKTELDARETALIERLNALDEKVNALDKRLNALAENEKSKANVQTIPPDAQSQDVIRDEAQTKAERDRRIQEFRTEIRARQNNRDPPHDSSGRKTYSANGSRIWTKRRSLAKRYFLRRRLVRQLHLLR